MLNDINLLHLTEGCGNWKRGPLLRLLDIACPNDQYAQFAVAGEGNATFYDKVDLDECHIHKRLEGRACLHRAAAITDALNSRW